MKINWLTFFSADSWTELVIDAGAHLCDDLFLHLLDQVKVWNIVHMFVVRCGGHFPELILICSFDTWVGKCEVQQCQLTFY